MKIVERFRLKIVIFSAVKNRCMLHGSVFVMSKTNTIVGAGAYGTPKLSDDVMKCYHDA